MYKYIWSLPGYEYNTTLVLMHEYEFEKENLDNFLIESLKFLKNSGRIKKDGDDEFCSLAGEISDYLKSRKGFKEPQKAKSFCSTIWQETVQGSVDIFNTNPFGDRILKELWGEI